MATRETQSLIIDTAIDLFNGHGSKAVSTNRIADTCELSRGNLHYHFRTKEEIIQTIFRRIEKQMSEGWYEDHLDPTIERMRLMFRRQMQLIWDYRFFYRELNMLLHDYPLLKVRFMDSRRSRVKEVELFFQELAKSGLVHFDDKPGKERLLLISWLITDQWMPYLDMNDLEVGEETIEKGLELIFQAFQPHFTEAGWAEYSAIQEREATSSR